VNLPAVAFHVAAFRASKPTFEIHQPLMTWPSFCKAGWEHRSDMTTIPAGDSEHMPLSQITEANLIFRSEHVGLKLMAFCRGRVS
jgi:hypothetical protein